MVDDQTRAAMFAAAITIQQHSLSLHLPIEDEFEDLNAVDEEEIEQHDEQTEVNTSQIMHLGSLVLVVAAMLPPPATGSTIRGPYNQYQKCTQFFVASLEWPDRQFRHEYQSVSAFFRMVSRTEPSH